MKKLYIIRHGESKWNKVGKIQGQENIKLTKKGELQALMVADRIKNDNINHIYSSDLNRAYSTAKIIGTRIGINIEPQKKLREINFGDWQGLTLREVEERHNNEYFVWRKTPHLSTIPKGESLVAVQERAMNFIQELHKKHVEENILLVAHGVVIKVIILGLLDLDLSNYRKISINNCGLSIIEFKEGRPVIRCLNERTIVEE